MRDVLTLAAEAEVRSLKKHKRLLEQEGEVLRRSSIYLACADNAANGVVRRAAAAQRFRTGSARRPDKRCAWPIILWIERTYHRRRELARSQQAHPD